MALAPIAGTSTGMEAFLESLKSGAQNKLINAQAKEAEAKSNLPFGGANVPGPAGQIVGLEMIKGLYGDNSPQYKQASEAFNLNQEGVKSRVNYQNILSDTANKRFSTPLAKSTEELNDVRDGYAPGRKRKLTPEEQEQYENIYGLDLLKKTTDSDTRKKNLYSTNIDVTLGNIDPKALTQFSGVKGAAQLLKERLLDQQGNTTPQYKAYQDSLTNARLLAKQVRQFYGDSITPGVQKGLSDLTNPSTWLNSPEIAMRNFNSFAKTLKSERGTYSKATKSPAVYGGNNDENEGIIDLSKNEDNENNQDDLAKEAEEAIANGADRDKVMARLKQLRSAK
jgi:hypothetical protein